VRRRVERLLLREPVARRGAGRLRPLRLRRRLRALLQLLLLLLGDGHGR
jgi:hypothetical protein